MVSQGSGFRVQRHSKGERGSENRERGAGNVERVNNRARAGARGHAGDDPSASAAAHPVGSRPKAKVQAHAEPRRIVQKTYVKTGDRQVGTKVHMADAIDFVHARKVAQHLTQDGLHLARRGHVLAPFLIIRLGGNPFNVPPDLHAWPLRPSARAEYPDEQAYEGIVPGTWRGATTPTQLGSESRAQDPTAYRMRGRFEPVAEVDKPPDYEVSRRVRIRGHEPPSCYSARVRDFGRVLAREPCPALLKSSGTEWHPYSRTRCRPPLPLGLRS